MLSIDGTNITLTRGDTAYITLPILQSDGETPYEFEEGDEVRLQVRSSAITSDTETELIFSGNISISDGVPIWHITTENSTINCGSYVWDVELITAAGEVCTYNSGKLKITKEVTI